MALIIDPEACIDCGACLDPCPNSAIQAGGEPYTLDGEEKEALSDKYYIVPELCTECVGFHDEPQCVDACPVDCIPKDPNHEETQEQLEAKVKKLHPDK
jgi:ferredoxin